MKLTEIKNELKGYFIHRQDRIRTLGFKQGNDFKLITDNIHYSTLTDTFELTPMRYLLMQINQQLLDPTAYVTEITDVLEMINFNIFEDYDKRESEIKKHKEILAKIRNSKSIFGRKKDFKLIYTETNNTFEQGRKYYVIKDNDVVPIESALLDNVDNAVEVSSIDIVRKALNDNFLNEYAEKYNKECEKWESI